MYVWQLEELRQRVSTQNLAATIAAAWGADTEQLEWDEVRGEFDTALAAKPARADPDELALDRALGLRR